MVGVEIRRFGRYHTGDEGSLEWVGRSRGGPLRHPLVVSRLLHPCRARCECPAIAADVGPFSDLFLSNPLAALAALLLQAPPAAPCLFILWRARVSRHPSDTGLSATYTFEPLTNLVYTRDQQVGGRVGGWILWVPE